MTHFCRTGFTIVSAVAVMLVSSACDSERSSNPLSPQIAGPLAGVTITSPASTQPTDGQLISVTSQPVSLVFTNATSNSVRPFLYDQLMLRLSSILPDMLGHLVVLVSVVSFGATVYMAYMAVFISLLFITVPTFVTFQPKAP